MITFKILSLLPVLITGWGGDGHSIITHVASQLIDSRSQGFLTDLLGTDYIEAARWADTDEAAAKYPGSKYYHFSNTPYRNCQTFDFERDCGATPQSRGLCLASGLARFIQIATDISASQEARADAIKFILHLMGDIHQPLHTAFDHDKGGTRIILGHPADISLHELWDYGLLDAELSEKNWRHIADDVYARVAKDNHAFVDRIEKQQNVGHVVGNGDTSALIDYAAYIASETSTTMTCKFAYMDEKASFIEREAHVSEMYYKTRGASVKVLLAKASARLAILINHIVFTYRSRLSEQRYLARSVRVREFFEQSRASVPNPRDLLAGNSFAPLHDLSSHYIEQGTELTNGSHTECREGGKSSRKRVALSASEMGPMNWTSVAEENKALSSRYILDGVDLSRIRGYSLRSKFFVSYADSSRKKRLFFPKAGTIVRSINHLPDFVFFDKAVFNESSFSPELAKRAFLKAKGHDIDAVVNTSAIERRLGYMEGLDLRDDVYVPYPVRHEFKSSETSGVLYYGGEDVMEIEPVEYMRNRVRYSQFYVERISTFMMHQLDRQYLGVTYADFYRKNMALVGSELIMIAEGRISLITLKHLWEKGDGRVPNTVNEGYYYLYIPTFTDIESPWVLLVDFRIFPGPPPNDYEAVSEMLQASTKTREPIAPGRNAIAWFQAFEEFCYGNKIDRLSSLSALAT